MKIYDLSESQYEAFMDLIPKDLMADRSVHYLCAIDEEDYASGILAYRIKAGIVELLYINIYEELDGEGIESELLDGLLERVKASDSLYYITSVFPANKRYKYLRRAIKKNDEFMLTGNDALYYLKPEDRTNFKYYEKIKDITEKPVLFSDLDRRAKKKFYQYIQTNDMEFTFADEEPLLEGDLSVCTLDKDGEVASCILFKKKRRKEVELSFMMVKPGHEMDMGILLADALRKLSDKYPEAYITINAVNDKSIKLIDNVFGDSIRKETVYTAIRL